MNARDNGPYLLIMLKTKQEGSTTSDVYDQLVTHTVHSVWSAVMIC